MIIIVNLPYTNTSTTRLTLVADNGCANLAPIRLISSTLGARQLSSTCALLSPHVKVGSCNTYSTVTYNAPIFVAMAVARINMDAVMHSIRASASLSHFGASWCACAITTTTMRHTNTTKVDAVDEKKFPRIDYRCPGLGEPHRRL